MKKLSLTTLLRTGILFFAILFAVIAGNFLYTGSENAVPLEHTIGSEPLSENALIIQYFTPKHSYVTSIAIAVDKANDSDVDGNLLVTLKEVGSDITIYENTFPLQSITDMWYLDFPITKRLNINNTYMLSVSAQNCPPEGQPALYLSPSEYNISENQKCSFSNMDLDELNMAVRYTYNVVVPARLIVFVIALIAMILLFICSILIPIKKEYTFRSILSLSMKNNKTELIHIAMFCVVTLGAIALRFFFLSVKSNDYYLCYESWINDIRSHGGIASLRNNIGDYPPLYMTLLTLVCYLPFEPVVIIKIMPCLFDFILALVCLRLLSAAKVTNIVAKLSLYSLILLNPITLFNSAAWGQCDSMYTVFSLLAIYGACNIDSEKWYSSGDGILLLYGISLSLKLQAIFLFPIFGLILIMQKKNRIKLVHFLWIPIIYTISCIPMYLAGRDLKVMFKIYLGQANRNYGTLNLNYPNLYSLIGNPSSNMYNSFFMYGLLLTFIILLFVYYFAYCKDLEMKPLNLYKLSAITIFIICFFLPSVHERYAYLAEILLCIILLLDSKYIKITIATLLCTLFTYCTYLYELETTFKVAPDWIIALVRLSCIVYILKDLFYQNKISSQSA